MRFTTTLELRFSGTPVPRAPTFWERVKQAVHAKVDLTSDERQVSRHALALAEETCAGLRAAGISDATLLAVDKDVLFRDEERQADDLDLLLWAAHEHAERLTSDFRALRLVFEHREDGLETLIEARFNRRFHEGQPAATVTLSARVSALRPRPGESSSDARARVEAVLHEPSIVAEFRAQLEALAERARAALAAQFPDAEVRGDAALAQLQRPSRQRLSALLGHRPGDARVTMREQPRFSDRPATLYDDPWDTYYEDPLETWTELTVLSWMLREEPGQPHAAHLPFPVHVTDAAGRPLCEADQLGESRAHFAGVAAAACVDYDRADAALPSDYGWDRESGSDGPSGDASSSSSRNISSDCSSDCASSDCASSDCFSSDCGGGGWSD